MPDTVNRPYQQCKRCVMDTTARLISFDRSGVCNYCRDCEKNNIQTIFRPREVRYKEFDEAIAHIRKKGKGKSYDCILGISGGMDSSYLAVIAKENGLRPLVVHFDNGWNDELAVKNIENIVKKLGYDLYTHVIDWEEFKDLQLAYFKASVIDIEVPTDNLIISVLYKIAIENNIKVILSGMNPWTETILPDDWAFVSRKSDLVNILNIHRRYGTVKLKSYPTFSAWKKYYYTHIAGIEFISCFYQLDYNAKKVEERLKKEFEWKPYSCKHFESVFTRFYQGYILPKKFNVDKRKAHYSTLICSKQMTKEEALIKLQSPPYPVEQQLKDKDYVIKKWGITDQFFEEVMRLPPVSHEKFGMEKKFFMERLQYKLHLMYLYKFAYPLRILKRPAL